VSHEGRLEDAVDEALAFLAHMKTGLGERLGPCFLQLPPSFGPDRGADLARFLNPWRRASGHPLAVEVRHPAWFEPGWLERLDTLLARSGLARVHLDTRPCYQGVGRPMADAVRPKPRVPLQPTLTTDWVMVRYVGHPDVPQNEPWLAQWAERIDGWLRRGVDVWAYCHCPVEDHSPTLARRLQELLEARGAPVDPLPWNALRPDPNQPSLF